MGRMPCGCDLVRDARETGGDEGETLEHFAKEYQREWRCPFAGFREPKPGDAERLTDECRIAIGAVEGLIGADRGSFDTCPCWYARQQYVADAVNAYWHAQNGGLAEYEPNASQALFDAVHLIRAGSLARQNREFDEAKRRMEERANAPPDSAK